MVRQKNVLGTIMHSFFLIAGVSVLWGVVGYSLAFGPDRWHFIGGLDWLGLRVTGEKEEMGLDQSQHSEAAYGT